MALVVRRDGGREDQMKEQIVGFEVEHVQGPEAIPYRKNELASSALSETESRGRGLSSSTTSRWALNI